MTLILTNNEHVAVSTEDPDGCAVNAVVTLVLQDNLPMGGIETIANMINATPGIGANIASVVGTFRQLGFNAKALRCDNEIPLLQTLPPFVAMIENRRGNHFVVVHRITHTDNGLQILIADKTLKSMTLSQFLATWKHVLIVAEKPE